MSIALSQDANRLIEDIELELASIRATMVMRTLDAPRPAASAATSAAKAPTPAIRAIGPFDLARAGGEAAAPPGPVAEPAAPDAPKRMTLQQRLAAMSDKD